MCWIFGYGSLIWRPSFPYEERVTARLRGWSRRFWQGSTDHRGVPGAPGRVVTLVESPGAACDGVAFRVREEDLADVLAHLDHREKGGYERRQVTLDTAKGPLETLLFLATSQNPEFLGPAPLERIARQVVRSHGPSGPNREYVLELARALRDLGARDRHVFALEARVRRLLDKACSFTALRVDPLGDGPGPHDADLAERLPGSTWRARSQRRPESSFARCCGTSRAPPWPSSG